MVKTVIITGASGNLGKATVNKMLTEGYRVIAVSHSNNNFEFVRGTALFEQHSVDLSNEAASSAFVDDLISRFTNIDAALLLAGGYAMGDINNTGGDELKRMYSLNFETAFYIAMPVFRHMLTTGNGRIILVGARPALVASQGKNTIAYALSKSLLFKLSELLNEEAKGKNVVSAVIVPGIIDTDSNRQAMPEADFEKWVSAEQIADLILFICSNQGMAQREAVYKMYHNS
ncbi:MAG: SDR family NAD(P)-dependent oxidoreductase [Chitinophagaceae bacterium]